MKATITANELADLQREGSVVTRTLLYADGNYGVWNFDTAKEKTITIAGLESYTSKNLITSVDDLEANEYGFISTTKKGENGPGSVYLVAKAIPEPATATLSLLALAGLCARRRRG